MKKSFLITGATGYIGGKLTRRLLKSGYHTVIVTRNTESAQKKLPSEIECVLWPTDIDFPLPTSLEKEFYGIINLCGQPIGDGRWTKQQKIKIYESRVASTRRIVHWMEKMAIPPKVFLSASATGFYGDRGDKVLDEKSGVGNDFLSKVCGDWEKEALGAQSLGICTFLLRFGLVIGSHSPILAKLLPTFQLGLGGVLGSGRQWMSWIYVEDLLDAILFLIEKLESSQNTQGAVNIVSPQPVTNREFTKALGAISRRPTFFKIPQFLLKILAGEMAEGILASQKALPSKLLDLGFKFKYPNLEGALRASTKTSLRRLRPQNPA